MKERFFWSGTYTILKESYGIVAICAFIAMKYIPTDTVGEKLMTALAFVGVAQLILMPVWTFYVLYKYRNMLGEKSFKKKYGAWNEELREDLGAKVTLWPMLFFIRRVLLAVTILYVNHIFW